MREGVETAKIRPVSLLALNADKISWRGECRVLASYFMPDKMKPKLTAEEEAGTLAQQVRLCTPSLLWGK